MLAVAVVIPLYNHAAFIEAALASVLAQTHPARRILVIDDGSTDDSAQVAEAFLARNGGLGGRGELIRQENRGAHEALNRGIERAADCELVAILNSDDEWAPDRLERCLAVLKGNRAAEVVCTGLHLVDSAGAVLGEDSPKARRNGKIWERVERENDPLLSLAVSNFAKTTSNLVARRRFCLEHPFANLRYVHDYRFLLEAAWRGKLAVLPADLLAYRVHETNTIKAGGRRAVVAETVQMHLDLLGALVPELAASPEMRRRGRLYFQRVLGNFTDFRGELLLQVVAQAARERPELFQVAGLGEYGEFEAKAERLPEG